MSRWERPATRMSGRHDPTPERARSFQQRVIAAYAADAAAAYAAYAARRQANIQMCGVIRAHVVPEAKDIIG